MDRYVNNQTLTEVAVPLSFVRIDAPHKRLRAPDIALDGVAHSRNYGEGNGVLPLSAKPG